MEVCAASSMERTHYAFVTCLVTGAPWSEQPEGITFDNFMMKTFESSLAGGEPSQAQDREFSCAHPIRNGSNSMLKGPDACIGFDNQETGRVIFSLRGLWSSADRGDIIRSPELGRSPTKFWLAVRSKQEVTIPDGLGNDRNSPFRRRPADIAGLLPPELLEQVKDVALETVEMLQVLIRQQRVKRPRLEEDNAWNCLKKLLVKVGMAEVVPDEQRSTAWKAAGETVYAPGDIVRRQCTCARSVSFADQMSKDCKGLGTSNVARKTRFDEEAEVIPALLHANKSKSLCELRVGSISKEDIVRLKVHQDNLGFATLVCRLGSYIDGSASRSQDHSKVFATDKHRMLWLINMQELSSIDDEGDAQSGHPEDIRLTQSRVRPEVLEVAYQRGTLHVIKAAPKMDYSTRISLEPCLPAAGEYLGVILRWVGNRAYQHTAMVRSAAAENTLGLGVLRSAFFIRRPWRGPSIDCENVLKDRVDPDSTFMKDVLKKRGIHLSEDQKACMRKINSSNNPHLKIQAYAGTGKSLLLSLLVEAALKLDCPQAWAVVIVTPSRNLRDAILQGPDFKSSVFTDAELGPRVIWLGRPSDSVGALCSWEERMWILINEQLHTERTELQQFESSHLRPAFRTILSLKIPWSDLPSGEPVVIDDTWFRALDDFRTGALRHMLRIVQIKLRRAKLMDDVLREPRGGHLIVSTMDAFVKWRAGDTKGCINRFLESLQVQLFCMEEYESFDVSQVVAALSNFHAKTLLMVGDEHQRVETNFRRRCVNFNGEGSFGDLHLARYGLEDDAEQYDLAQLSSDIDTRSLTVPEARPWHEWCINAEDGVLDRCKRCGDAVCDYVKHCFEFAETFTSDKRVAYETVLEHVFFEGSEWQISPLRRGEEVGWHPLLFQALCHIVFSDLGEYMIRHPGTSIFKLPIPTVMVVMPLSRSAIPLCVLVQEACKQRGYPTGVVQVSLPLNTRGRVFRLFIASGIAALCMHPTNMQGRNKI